jgi:hypothetical protein
MGFRRTAVLFYQMCTRSTPLSEFSSGWQFGIDQGLRAYEKLVFMLSHLPTYCLGLTSASPLYRNPDLLWLR